MSPRWCDESHSPPSTDSGSDSESEPEIEGIDLVLDELLKKPNLGVVLKKARVWAQDVWFTSNGQEFYLRHPGTCSLYSLTCARLTTLLFLTFPVTEEICALPRFPK